MPHTHVGKKLQTGYRHYGARLHGHTTPKAGRLHALTATGSGNYASLCGERLRDNLIWDEVRGLDGCPQNVWACTAADAPAVSCKRCLQLLAK